MHGLLVTYLAVVHSSPNNRETMLIHLRPDLDRALGHDVIMKCYDVTLLIGMIRSAVQCLRRSYCVCRRPLQLLEHSSHQTVVAEVPAYTFERRYCCTRAFYSNWRAPLCIVGVQQRQLHCSSLSGGLAEFFPKTDDIIEEGEHTGKCKS